MEFYSVDVKIKTHQKLSVFVENVQHLLIQSRIEFQSRDTESNSKFWDDSLHPHFELKHIRYRIRSLITPSVTTNLE